MKTKTQKVKEFHELFEHPIGSLNETEPLKVRQLRIKLLFEELNELSEAGDLQNTFFSLCNNYIKNLGWCYPDGDDVNKTEELDALCDIEYVLHGKINTSGIHEIFDEAFDLVHENNMNKAHSTKAYAEETINKNNIEATIVERFGGFLVIRSDGKLIKPWNHKKVDLSKLFIKQN